MSWYKIQNLVREPSEIILSLRRKVAKGQYCYKWFQKRFFFKIVTLSGVSRSDAFTRWPFGSAEVWQFKWIMPPYGLRLVEDRRSSEFTPMTIGARHDNEVVFLRPLLENHVGLRSSIWKNEKLILLYGHATYYYNKWYPSDSLGQIH